MSAAAPASSAFLYSDYTRRQAKITGGDFSEELLDKAREKLAERGDTNVNFPFLDFNKPFEFDDNTFDLCTSAFAIYYASDLDFTFGEAHRVLKPGGRLFVSGPLPENKQMFYDIIKEATNATIPPMPGSSRFKGDIFNTIDRHLCENRIAQVRKPAHLPRSRAVHRICARLVERRPQTVDIHVQRQG